METQHPITMFIAQYCTLGDKHRTTTKRLYDKWVTWCLLVGRVPGTKAAFTKVLLANYPSVIVQRDVKQSVFLSIA